VKKEKILTKHILIITTILTIILIAVIIIGEIYSR